MHDMKTALVALFLFPVMAYGAIYKWTDSEGNTHYSETAPKEKDTEEVDIQAGPSENEVSEAKERIKRTNEQLEIYEQDNAQKQEMEKTQKDNSECAALAAHIEKLQSPGPYVLDLDEKKRLMAVGDKSKSQLADHYRDKMKKLGCK